MGCYTDFVLTCSVCDDGDDGPRPWEAFEAAVHGLVGSNYFKLEFVHDKRPGPCAMQLGVAIGVVKFVFEADEFEALRSALRDGAWGYPEYVLMLAHGEYDESAWVLYQGKA